jgi:hypothetical protein
MGAAAVKESDSVVVLDATGKLTVHEARSLAGAGSVAAEGLILSIGLIQAEGASHPTQQGEAR